MEFFCSVWCFLKDFFTISEWQSRLTDFRVPVITWCVTLYFAWRTFCLDRKIYKLNQFHWKAFVNVMVPIWWWYQGNLIRFMFTNHSNVKWFIDNIYAKTASISLKERLKKFYETWSFYEYMLPFWNRDYIIWPQWLPMEFNGNESKELYVDYFLESSSLNDVLHEKSLLLKWFIFVDSLWKKYEFKINKKWFEEFITTKKQLLEYENT